MPYMSNEEVTVALREYDEQGFESIPDWLQHELRSRDLPFEVRHPTIHEKRDTIQDAKEHRIGNNERIIEDFQDKYNIRRK
jgi:hypothetical protein